MATAFGKFCRLLRINNDEVLRDMAHKLDVSLSYLSAVENGKRPIPHSWRDEIVRLYSLTEVESKDLDNAIYHSFQEVKITFDLNRFSSADRDKLIALARRYDELDGDSEISLLELLKGFF